MGRFSDMYKRPMDAKGQLDPAPTDDRSAWQRWVDSWYLIARLIINKELK
jgi:hypothetical protein